MNQSRQLQKRSYEQKSVEHFCASDKKDLLQTVVVIQKKFAVLSSKTIIIMKDSVCCKLIGVALRIIYTLKLYVHVNDVSNFLRFLSGNPKKFRFSLSTVRVTFLPFETPR